MHFLKKYESILENYLIKESLDNPYKWKFNFKTEEVYSDWDDTGEEYSKEVLSPVQIIHFKTDEGVPYIWYAKQNLHNDHYWEIAFGEVEKDNGNGSYETNIEKTGKGNAFRVFATAIDITNSFIEQDDAYQISNLIIKSKGKNRTSLYKKYLLPKIENFELVHDSQSGDESELHLQRTS